MSTGIFMAAASLIEESYYREHGNESGLAAYAQVLGKEEIPNFNEMPADFHLDQCQFGDLALLIQDNAMLGVETAQKVYVSQDGVYFPGEIGHHRSNGVISPSNLAYSKSEKYGAFIRMHTHPHRGSISANDIYKAAAWADPISMIAFNSYVIALCKTKECLERPSLDFIKLNRKYLAQQSSIVQNALIPKWELNCAAFRFIKLLGLAPYISIFSEEEKDRNFPYGLDFYKIELANIYDLYSQKFYFV